MKVHVVWRGSFCACQMIRSLGGNLKERQAGNGCTPFSYHHITQTNKKHMIMRKILCCLMLAYLFPLLAAAQDVIMKRDGNTVVCRIVEVGESEVVYKRWSNLQGNNYVMNIADITSIHYENGKKLTFNGNAPEPVPTQTQTQTPAWTNPNRQMGEMNDAQLLDLARKKDLMKVAAGKPEKKVKNLKIAAWTVGPLAVAGGLAMIFVSRDYDVYDGYYEEVYFDTALTAPGSILLVGGVATTTGCLIRAHNLKKRMVQSTPIYGHDFQFKNGSALSTNICSLTDSRSPAPALGIGLNYHF